MENRDKFAHVRKSLRLSQDEMSKIMNITRQSISNYENGFNIPMRTKKILCTIFGININWWEDDNEPMFVDKSDEIGKNQLQNVASTAQNGGTVDTLVAMLAEKDRQLSTKDKQITDLINQLSAKDKQINKLQSIIETHLNLPATDVAMAG